MSAAGKVVPFCNPSKKFLWGSCEVIVVPVLLSSLKGRTCFVQHTAPLVGELCSSASSCAVHACTPAQTHQGKVKPKILLIVKALQRGDILFVFPFCCLCTNLRTKCSCLCYTQTSRLKTPSWKAYLNTKKFEKTASLLPCLPSPTQVCLVSLSSLFKTSGVETEMQSQKQLFKTICGHISLTWKPGGRIINNKLVLSEYQWLA